MLKSVFGPALLGVFLAASAPIASAQETLRMHSPLVESRPEEKHIASWVKTVNEDIKATGGTTQIQLYDGGSLGVKDADLLRVLPSGQTIHLAAALPNYLNRDLPELGYSLPAGVVSDLSKLPALYAVMKGLYEKSYDKFGLKLVGLVYPSDIDVSIHCKTPVRTLADLAQKKLRVWEKHHVDTFRELGISAQIIPQAELYLALQTGVVDCAAYGRSAASTVSLPEVAPYSASLFRYTIHPFTVVMAKSVWDTLRPEDQKAMIERGKQIEELSFSQFLSPESQTEAEAAYQEKGGKMEEPFSDEDQAAFVEAARKVWVRLNTEAGPIAQENMKLIEQAMQ